MREKIFKNMCMLVICVVFVVAVVCTAVYYRTLEKRVMEDAADITRLIRKSVESGGVEYLKNIDSHSVYRITYIAQDGTVLFDNLVEDTQLSSLSNHLNRPEVKEAVKNGSGQDIRVSGTMDIKYYYYAEKLQDKSVLRIAMKEKSEMASVIVMIPELICVVFVISLFAFLVSGVLTKRMIEPINQMDFENPEYVPEYIELTPLVEKIRNQKKVIVEQIQDIRSSKIEFQTITENMSEGLIVVDRKEQVLSYNKSAVCMLNLEADLGENNNQKRKNFAAFCRNKTLIQMVEKILKGERCEKKLHLNGSIYQCIASPVVVDGEIQGGALLVLDETEKELREELRREFSANVSHELKTPLTSISGYAEIMESGFVKDEDMLKFSGIIHSEAKRLIHLVEDIIKISRLDDNTVQLQKEQVDLKLLAEENISYLKALAQKRAVTIHLIGSSGVVLGVRQILEEMVHNVIENAVKYNKENGKVLVSVDTYSETKKVIFTVQDTGIGIPKEDVERVFERFYRVDKSHSKEIGGTGLGLSIVKHGAIFHNAQIKLESEQGKGTIFQIQFPIISDMDAKHADI